MKLDLIMIDECGSEIKCETFKISDDLDEDWIDIWKEEKIAKYKTKYPEARRFYFERPFSDMSYHELLMYAE